MIDFRAEEVAIILDRWRWRRCYDFGERPFWTEWGGGDGGIDSLSGCGSYSERVFGRWWTEISILCLMEGGDGILLCLKGSFG